MGVWNIYGLLLLAVSSREIIYKVISVPSGAVEVLYICVPEMLKQIHTEQKQKRKRNFCLIFVVYSLIFFGLFSDLYFLQPYFSLVLLDP